MFYLYCCIYLHILVSNSISMSDGVVLINSNTTDVASGAGTSDSSGATVFTQVFSGIAHL
jgi:hypothetical protein